MDDTSPDKLLCSTFINDTLIKETSDIDLLFFAERFPHLLEQQDDHGRFPVHMAAQVVDHPTSFPSVSVCIQALLQHKTKMERLHFTFYANPMQPDMMLLHLRESLRSA